MSEPHVSSTQSATPFAEGLPGRSIRKPGAARRLWCATRAAFALLSMTVFATVGAGLAVAQDWRPMVFRADAPGVDDNPLRGLVPFATGRREPISFPHSMEWFSLPLSDVVTGPGTYDWSALEKQLTMIAGHGNQAIFRFYIDNPKLPSGVPRYLLHAGLKTFPYSDEDNAKSKTPSVGPDYSDPRLIECMVGFIHALGLKYDGDARIAYLTAGLYGFWGEWHVLRHPLPGEPAGWTIAQKDKDALLRAYAQSFQRTPVLVRTAVITKDRELLSHFGFHDDSFLQDTIGPGPWQFWQGMRQAGMEDSWEQHPTGGEIFPPIQAGIWSAWPNAKGQDLTTTIATTHATFMFDSTLFATVPAATEKANAQRAQRMLGYTLFCSSARIVRGKNGSATVTVRIENRGVAPMYYAWPVELEYLDGSTKVVARGGTAWPLPTLLPGKTAEWSVSLQHVPHNAKTLVLRVANPMPCGHSVAFANAEMGTVMAGWLTLDVAGQR
jgi:Domain of unknown function (DUF4832)